MNYSYLNVYIYYVFLGTYLVQIFNNMELQKIMSYNVHKLSILQKNKKPDTLICNTFQYTEHFEFSTDNDEIIKKRLEIKILQFFLFHIIMTHS